MVEFDVLFLGLLLTITGLLFQYWQKGGCYYWIP